MIFRTLKQKILQLWSVPKAIVVLGPRQVGKTTLIHQICREAAPEGYLTLNADDLRVRQDLSNIDLATLRNIIGKNKVVFIDEAQRVHNIGLVLKLITDELAEIKLLVSGSSALELANEINEPLTGRKREFIMFPISWQEYADYIGSYEASRQLETRLIFGMYPEVITSGGDEITVLQELAGSYLYKDILNFQGIRKPEILDKLLKALALQVGAEVSYNELSNLLNIDRGTIENYLGILEKAFIIFRLSPFSGNLRNEINQSRKIYFFDNGIRNAIIGDFRLLNNRLDVGALWENFIISELRKKRSYAGWYGRSYFWRTYQGQEIDYVEEIDRAFNLYEIKYSPKKQIKLPKTFGRNYPVKESILLNAANFTQVLLT